MNWEEARATIEESIIEGTDLNTNRSSFREVIQANHQCTRYDYNDEQGFLVRISHYDINDIDIPWSMLEKCFDSLREPEGYNGDVFRRFYPQQANNHPCHVHVVGMIYKKAGIAKSNPQEMNYYLIE